MTPRLRTALLTGAWALLAAGCAVWPDPGRIPMGTPMAQVLRELGRPTAQYPAVGTQPERLQYSYQPAGQRVVNLDVDAQGRVTRVSQPLDDALFGRAIQPDHWTQQDVLREYGRPARVEQVHTFKGSIWVWRYTAGPVWRLLFIDIDPAGVVKGWSTGDEDLGGDLEPAR